MIVFQKKKKVLFFCTKNKEKIILLTFFASTVKVECMVKFMEQKK